MEKTALSIVLFLFLFTQAAFAQGTIRGKITDDNGEPVYQAKIYLKGDLSSGVLSDFDGLYSLKVKNSNPQLLIVDYVFYDSIKEPIQVTENQVIIRDFTLTPEKEKGEEIGEIDIVQRRIRSNDNYMDGLKQNSAVTLDYISGATMKKIGDPSVFAAVARVSGVSTNGGLITVRGIGDRYVKTTLNGLRIPTLDPLTNNIKLDIFPSSLIDNVIISKTASPDLPGDWAGAYISVETKDYSDKLLVSIETQVGYNAQTSFKEIISSQRSSTDWLGYDGGLRSRDNTPINAPNLTPTTYQEMVALGLGSYFKSIGVNGWIDGSPESDMYFKLGLVELGILPIAKMNDIAAYQEARDNYLNTYKPAAFNALNPEKSDYNNGFSNNWNTVLRKAPLNFSQNFSIGNQSSLFGRPIGYLFGFRYGNSVRYDGNGISQRIGAEELNYQLDLRDVAQMSRETNGWNALLNLAYTLNENNKVSFLFMPNFTGTNDVARFTTESDFTSFQEGRTQVTQFYEQRKQIVSQVKSEHFFKKSKMKIEFDAGFTRGNSTAPDFKITQYAFIKENDVIVDYIFSPTAGDGIRRYFRYLKDDIFDSKIAADLPIAKKQTEQLVKKGLKLVRKVKFGGAYQYNSRRSDLEEYYLIDGNTINKEQLNNDDLDGYLNPSKFIINNQEVDFFYSDRFFERNHTFGHTQTIAGFAMIDYEFKKGLRISGGLRVENGQIFSDVVEYNRLGYGKNDLRRENIGGFPLVNAADINETNFLPSLNVIYKLKKIKFAETNNLRFNFSQTVARPSTREVNDAAVFDNEFRTLIYGNSDLKIVHVQNYDFRAESYFENNDNASISFFYKNFRNHIEMGFGSSGVTWENIDKSSVIGVELEGKKSIGKCFELRANATFVKSNSVFVRKDLQIIDGVKVYTPIDTINRPMFGQAPYIINAIASYKNDSIGLVATVSYNIQGARLVITGVVKGRPDIYEMPRNMLDFKVSKTLGKHFTASLTMRDLLNARVRRAYRLPDEWKDFDNFRYGTNFILGVTYKL